MIIRVVSVLLMVVLTAFCGLIFFSNLDYFDHVSSYGTIIVTFGVLVIVTLVFVAMAIKMKKPDRKVLLSAIVIFITMIIVPIRAIYLTNDFNPLNDVTVTLTQWKHTTGYSSYNTDAHIRVKPNTDKEFYSIVGQLEVYDNDTLVALYPNVELLVRSSVISNPVNIVEKSPALANIDESSLRIYFVYDTISFTATLSANRYFTYEPVRVRLK